MPCDSKSKSKKCDKSECCRGPPGPRGPPGVGAGSTLLPLKVHGDVKPGNLIRIIPDPANSANNVACGRKVGPECQFEKLVQAVNPTNPNSALLPQGIVCKTSYVHALPQGGYLAGGYYNGSVAFIKNAAKEIITINGNNGLTVPWMGEFDVYGYATKIITYPETNPARNAKLVAVTRDEPEKGGFTWVFRMVSFGGPNDHQLKVTKYNPDWTFTWPAIPAVNGTIAGGLNVPADVVLVTVAQPMSPIALGPFPDSAVLTQGYFTYTNTIASDNIAPWNWESVSGNTHLCCGIADTYAGGAGTTNDVQNPIADTDTWATITPNFGPGQNKMTFNLNLLYSTETDFDYITVYRNDTVIFSGTGIGPNAGNPYKSATVSVDLLAGEQLYVEFTKDSSWYAGIDKICFNISDLQVKYSETLNSSLIFNNLVTDNAGFNYPVLSYKGRLVFGKYNFEAPDHFRMVTTQVNDRPNTLGTEGMFFWAIDAGSAAGIPFEPVEPYPESYLFNTFAGGVALDPNNNATITIAGNYETTQDQSETVPMAYSSFIQDVRRKAKGAFVARLGPNKNWLWAKSFDGQGDITINDMTYDMSGCLHVVGNFSGENSIDGISLPGAFDAITAEGAFIAKFSTNGEVLSFEKMTYDPDFQTADNIYCTNHNELYVTGTTKLSFVNDRFPVDNTTPYPLPPYGTSPSDTLTNDLPFPGYLRGADPALPASWVSPYAGPYPTAITTTVSPQNFYWKNVTVPANGGFTFPVTSPAFQPRWLLFSIGAEWCAPCVGEWRALGPKFSLSNPGVGLGNKWGPKGFLFINCVYEDPTTSVPPTQAQQLARLELIRDTYGVYSPYVFFLNDYQVPPNFGFGEFNVFNSVPYMVVVDARNMQIVWKEAGFGESPTATSIDDMLKALDAENLSAIPGNYSLNPRPVLAKLTDCHMYDGVNYITEENVVTINDLEADQQGNLYIVGDTNSQTFISGKVAAEQPNATFQPDINGPMRADNSFALKVHASEGAEYMVLPAVVKSDIVHPTGPSQIVDLGYSHTIIYYTPGSLGFWTGPNQYNDSAWGNQVYPGNWGSVPNLVGINVTLYAASAIPSNNPKTFKVTVWKQDVNGLPSTILYEETYSIGAFFNGASLSVTKNLLFTSMTQAVQDQIRAEKKVFIGIDFTGSYPRSTPRFGILQTVLAPIEGRVLEPVSPFDQAYVKYSDNTWHTLEESMGRPNSGPAHIAVNPIVVNGYSDTQVVMDAENVDVYTNLKPGVQYSASRQTTDLTLYGRRKSRLAGVALTKEKFMLV